MISAAALLIPYTFLSTSLSKLLLNIEIQHHCHPRVARHLLRWLWAYKVRRFPIGLMRLFSVRPDQMSRPQAENRKE